MEIFVGIGTIIGTAILLILRDWRDGKNILKKNEGSVDTRYLRQYYNHDLTEKLEQNTKKLDRLIELEEKEHEQSAGVRDVVKETMWLLKDIKEHGIECRRK